MVGLEPTRPYEQGILSPQCLPFHHTSIWRKAGESNSNAFTSIRLANGPLSTQGLPSKNMVGEEGLEPPTTEVPRLQRGVDYQHHTTLPEFHHSMVQPVGLEPTHPRVQVPKTCASTKFRHGCIIEKGGQVEESNLSNTFARVRKLTLAWCPLKTQQVGAEGGIRTHMLFGQGFLRPSCLPFHHSRIGPVGVGALHPYSGFQSVSTTLRSSLLKPLRSRFL